jgi:hypothetical protein
MPSGYFEQHIHCPRLTGPPVIRAYESIVSPSQRVSQQQGRDIISRLTHPTSPSRTAVRCHIHVKSIARTVPLAKRNSLFHRPPTSALATLGARKPAVCFCRSEQASIAVAAVRILAKPTRTLRRLRTGRERQARCFVQQIGPSRSAHCRRTAHAARRDLDGAEIAGAVWPLRFSDWLRDIRGLLARNLTKQPF